MTIAECSFAGLCARPFAAIQSYRPRFVEWRKASCVRSILWAGSKKYLSVITERGIHSRNMEISYERKFFSKRLVGIYRNGHPRSSGDHSLGLFHFRHQG